MASHVLRCQSCLWIMVYSILFIEGQTRLFRTTANTSPLRLHDTATARWPPVGCCHIVGLHDTAATHWPLAAVWFFTHCETHLIYS